MLRCQQQAVGQQAGPAVQRALCRHPRQIGKIIAFREMRQDHIGRLAVVAVLQELGRGLVREVPHPRKHPLLDRKSVV